MQDIKNCIFLYEIKKDLSFESSAFFVINLLINYYLTSK